MPEDAAKESARLSEVADRLGDVPKVHPGQKSVTPSAGLLEPGKCLFEASLRAVQVADAHPAHARIVHDLSDGHRVPGPVSKLPGFDHKGDSLGEFTAGSVRVR